MSWKVNCIRWCCQNRLHEKRDLKEARTMLYEYLGEELFRKRGTASLNTFTGHLTRGLRNSKFARFLEMRSEVPKSGSWTALLAIVRIWVLF